MPCSAYTLSLATIASVISVALIAIAFSTDNWSRITVDRLKLEVFYSFLSLLIQFKVVSLFFCKNVDTHSCEPFSSSFGIFVTKVEVEDNNSFKCLFFLHYLLLVFDSLRWLGVTRPCRANWNPISSTFLGPKASSVSASKIRKSPKEVSLSLLYFTLLYFLLYLFFSSSSLSCCLNNVVSLPRDDSPTTKPLPCRCLLATFPYSKY